MNFVIFKMLKRREFIDWNSAILTCGNASVLRLLNKHSTGRSHLFRPVVAAEGEKFRPQKIGKRWNSSHVAVVATECEGARCWQVTRSINRFTRKATKYLNSVGIHDGCWGGAAENVHPNWIGFKLRVPPVGLERSSGPGNGEERPNVSFAWQMAFSPSLAGWFEYLISYLHL
jgi:hypothetical protein